jgi:hypothetical protein
MYLPGVPKKITVGGTGPLQCESFRYFWGKSRYQDGCAKSEADIVESYNESGRHTRCSQEKRRF